MELTLGLDLGPASIGWALLDERGQRIVGCGVRVFPEGVDRDQKGGEVSKNEQRRIARGMRRQTARRARRKAKLRAALANSGLLPKSATLPPDNLERVQWESEQFKREDPYSLRARARREKLTPYEIGRTLLHLNQRRGFQSNRKTDRARRKENSEMLAEISQLAADMGDRTLGEYLASLRDDDSARHHLTRLRGRHTRRDMYKREFDAIWDAQAPHHPELLTNVLREQLERIIFFQRDLLPPSPSLVGRCELEPRLARCPRADRRAQRFRLFQEVNNLRIIDTSTMIERELSITERKKLIAYLSNSKERKFDAIRKHLFDQYESIRFNLERGERKALKGMPADAEMSHKSRYGKQWAGVPDDLKDRIVAAVIDADESRLEHLLDQASLTRLSAADLLDSLDQEQGHASYSLFAIKKLLPHLELGLPLTSRDPSKPCALRNAGYIMPWEAAADRKPFLEEPPRVTNPLVRQALFEVRKLVNAILRELVYKHGHSLARIHIELAREARGTLEQRSERARKMRERQAERDDAAERIRDYAKPTRESIDRYLLWKEQNEECIYSGRKIGIRQLLGGEVDVDHVLPYPRSLDNSFMNRVVCFRAENAAKGDRTPYEWLADRDPHRYEQILQRARTLPFPKLRRFAAKSVQLDDFFARQFVDTTYITTQVHDYVRGLAPDVVCTKGSHTAELRHHWGLNSVLRNDDLDLKNREDHRHHAVDAIVIALTSRARLQQLASIWRDGGTERTGEILPEPWSDFRIAVEHSVNSIRVSYRVRRSASGALHEETLYGPTGNPHEFVYRKPVVALTCAMLNDIRDPAIRSTILDHLKSRGIDPGTASKIPADAWVGLKMRSGIPIQRVRLVRREATIRPIRGGAAFVKPGSIHHVCFFELRDFKGRPLRVAHFVSTLEAMERTRRREPILQRKLPGDVDARFLFSLSANELVLLDHDGREDLYRFETGASTSKQMWFRHHAFAGRSADKRAQVSKMPNTLKARKVSVDLLGRLRWAND